MISIGTLTLGVSMDQKTHKKNIDSQLSTVNSTWVRKYKLGTKNYIDEIHADLLDFINSQCQEGNGYILRRKILQAIAKKAKISERRIRSRLNTLDKYDYIYIDKTHRPHTYFVNQLGKNVVKDYRKAKTTVNYSTVPSNDSQLSTVKSNMDRPHDLWISLKINQGMKPDNWNEKRLSLIKIRYPDYRHSPLKSGNDIYRFKAKIKGYKSVWVRSTPNKFIVEFFDRKSKELFENPYESMREVVKEIGRIARKLERIFKIPLVMENKISIAISKQSHALIKNEFADILLKKKDETKDQTGRFISLVIYDKATGRKIGEPDRSLGIYLPEFDFDHPVGSEEDAETMKDFIEDEIYGGGYESQVRRINFVENNIGKLSETTLELAKQINIHIPYWAETGSLNKEIKEQLIPTIKNLPEKTAESYIKMKEIDKKNSLWSKIKNVFKR